MNIFIPGTVRLIIHAAFQIAQHMGKAFLMIRSIIIKGPVMIVYKDPLVIFSDRVLYPFMPFFLTGKIQGFSISWSSCFVFFCIFSNSRSISSSTWNQ